MKALTDKRSEIVIYLGLIGSILLVYGQVGGHGFINYDDPAYILENYRVRTGLTLANIRWALMETHSSNWHPLTWFSHMLDVELFGMNAGGHHLVSLMLHGASTLLLFVVFRNTTGDRWRSAFVAALFALHPLHVESVVWAAERKDVLSTFFWFAAIWRYTRYTANPSFKNYWPVLLYFSLGLMSKPMVVTLPVVLLLMDYWPLGRYGGVGENDLPPIGVNAASMAVFVEKIPFFMLSAAVGVMTFLAQQGGQSVMRLAALPMGTRLTHSLVAYAGYIRKMILPGDLGVFYPHPGLSAWWKIVAAGIFIGAISVAAVRFRRRCPYVFVGWVWYLVTLVPVIGIVQVGLQGMADRYTYIPLTGLFVIVAWGTTDLIERMGMKSFSPILPAMVLLSGLSFISWMQVKLWSNEILLYRHTLEITQGNAKIHNNLGVALADRHETAAAIGHYLKALQIKPDDDYAMVNLANALMTLGRTDEAVALYERSLIIKPDSAKAHGNLGVALDHKGNTEKAIAHFHAALRFDPDYAMAHYNLSNTLAALGRQTEAVAHLQAAVRSNPFFAQAHNNLGVDMAGQGRVDEAIRHYTIALNAMPDFEEAHNNLGIALFRVGRTAEAVAHFKTALALNPGFAEARSNLEKINRPQE